MHDSEFIIAQTAYLIRQKHDREFLIQQIPIDDKKSFRLVARGDTSNVFELSHPLTKKLLKIIKPSSLSDLMVTMALHTGTPPWEAKFDAFLKKKQGAVKIKKIHPLVDEILGITYGELMYRKQFEDIAQGIGKLTEKQAIKLRKAVGAHRNDEVNRTKERFFTGSLKQNISEKKALAIFRLLQKTRTLLNQQYYFDYALESYRMAYLKAHYPEEFQMCCEKEIRVKGSQKMALLKHSPSAEYEAKWIL